MNKIYRIVFNQATQTWTAVAENARAKGKSGRTTVGSSKLTTLVGASAISVAALLSAQAMAEDTYFHVNNGTNSGTGDATTNLGSVTDAAGATKLYSLAAGMSAKADGQMAIAIGTGANAADSSAIAIGERAGTEGVANRTIMIGSYAGTKSSTSDSILVGSHSAYNRTGSGGLIAIGNGAGSYEMSTTENPGFPEGLAYTTAIGNIAAVNATGTYNDYIGTQAGYYRHGDYNVSMGYLAGAAQASYSAVDISGIRTGAMGHDNVFFGTYSGLGLNGNDNIAIGQMSNAAWKFDDKNKTGSMNDESIKVAYADDTIAIGQETTAQKNTAIAIGKGAKAATAEGDVALGAGSVTRAVTPTSSATINNVTYEKFAGAEPTSVVSVGDVGQERQIQNVAAGQITADSTDAINGSQLYAVADKLTAVDTAANRTNYFHVNTGNANQADGNATTNEGTVDAKGGATATGAIAAGVNAKALNSHDIAIGQNATAQSTAVGAISIGFEANAAAKENGRAAYSPIAIGARSSAKGTQAVAIGWVSQATNEYATAVGGGATASGYNSSVVGNYAQATQENAAAFGANAEALGQNATAIGTYSRATVTGATTLGAASTASGAFSTANGYSADATGTRSTSIGSDSQATANFATALGNGAWATAANATAVGSGARATGAASLAAGGAAQTQAFQSAAFGNGASVYAGGVQALALGSNATTNDANAVALGSGARTTAAVATTSATINGVTYDGFAGTAPIATVSVGNDTQKRTITNVAAGRISADSTDAINGSQLYAVADKLTAVDTAANRTNYFHVNTGDKNQAVGDADTNEGTVDAKGGATGLYSLAAGMSAKADGQMAVAIGTSANAVGSGAVAIGEQAGTKATMADRTVMIGSQAGNSSNTTNSVLLGSQSAYNRVGSGLVAIGTNAAGASTPLDFDNNLTSSVAIGESAAFDASGIWNSYIGTMAGSYKQGENNVGIGYYAGAGEIGSSGKKTEAGDTGSIGSNNVAFGYFAGSGVDGDDNIAIGQWANTGANPDGGFIGFNDTVALGRDTVANLDSNVAIGAEAKATTAEGDVALGAGSVTRAVTPTSSATINNVTYGTFAGAAPTSAVSVGAVGSERQIQNVAAGRITATSTDAINGSQLYAVADKLTADIKAADTNIHGRIDNLDKDYRAGVAGNAAMVNIPQVTRPGANLLGIGLGHHRGESAVAVGFSSSSDNEQLIFKMSGSANTQGDFTIGSGLGWQW
ncbi:hypothetical protein B0681_07810 [Moraxella porci DSM 25326]|uniref:Adhesin n=1 Tax=Moraxella porci DSM 25326 TaxID=573983 RepID=A0A1T0CNF6_9GAMM|nr:YadA-like family protein [Moraxella porci]OOS23866.1 hypothetical protein B0681_07810 [Moraxella porci DSM 25326]